MITALIEKTAPGKPGAVFLRIWQVLTVYSPPGFFMRRWLLRKLVNRVLSKCQPVAANEMTRLAASPPGDWSLPFFVKHTES